jgi:hypothetical protein
VRGEIAPARRATAEGWCGGPLAGRGARSPRLSGSRRRGGEGRGEVRAGRGERSRWLGGPLRGRCPSRVLSSGMSGEVASARRAAARGRGARGGGGGARGEVNPALLAAVAG